MSLDYSKIGLKVGLEVHQQLGTAAKLFCSCEPRLFKEDPEDTFLRRLRPTQSELGQVDPAALFEFQKGAMILYEANKETSCLVEMDEEPPHNLNREAVEIAVVVALMTRAHPVSEIHVMRKTVIDGSNTTGFQRTCVVALNGEIDLKGKRVPIQHISLEEDAARKSGEAGRVMRYRIDRLGIPLIEVTTAPVLYSPQEAEEAALAIGRILRATRKVRRGLGTIRQDLNVSIRDGALTEIKGVQNLELVSKVIENEVHRQLDLLKIRDELIQRGVTEENVTEKIIDVTAIFGQTKCTVIRDALKNHARVLTVKLPGFGGLLKRELAPGMRLGAEMAEVARFWGKVGGIFHTDELPAYGITPSEVEKLGERTGQDQMDAVIFVADSHQNATDALTAILERARNALKGVPEETRAANPDGSSRYMRPRPGAARMYPETDVPPIQLQEKDLQDLLRKLPELPAQKRTRLRREYQLNAKLTNQILNSEYADLFETIARDTRVSPTVIAVTLTETMKALSREGIQIDGIPDSQIEEMFRLIDAGKTTKEAIPEILSRIAINKDVGLEETIEGLGLTIIAQEELDQLIEEVIQKNDDLIEKRGAAAHAPLMGIIMKSVRGRVDAGLVSQRLKERLEKNHSETSRKKSGNTSPRVRNAQKLGEEEVDEFMDRAKKRKKKGRRYSGKYKGRGKYKEKDP